MGMADTLPGDLVVTYQDAFQHFDTNHSGFIPTKQLGPLLRFCAENPSEAEIQDGNGFINRQELRVVMMNLGEQLSEDEIECLIDDVDIDGDGQINYEEFYIMMTSSGK